VQHSAEKSYESVLTNNEFHENRRSENRTLLMGVHDFIYALSAFIL
jgi:hypothetical protein